MIEPTTTKPKLDCSLLDYDLFREWVEGKNDDDNVGTPRRDAICPIATYLREKIGVQVSSDGEPIVPTVGLSRVALRGFDSNKAIYGTACPTPHWAKSFIKGVDNIYGKAQRLTPKNVLEVLDSIKH